MQRNVLTTALVSMALVVPLPLLGVAVAGQSGSAPSTAAASGPAPTTLAGYPRPTVRGSDFVEGVRKHAEGSPLRLTGTVLQQKATTELAAEAEALGLQVTRKTYKGALTAVIATKQGTDRDGEVIVFGAHLDSMVGTVEGAYDNGTGVRTVMELARAFADVPTHRTLEFHFYNGEEEGALTSKEVAAEYATGGRAVSAYLGFDMVGIGFPVGGDLSNKNCLCMWHGARDGALEQVLRDVNFDFLRFPEDKQLVSIEGPNRRNSDEASWADKGYRTLRWAGLRRAADYPEYHKPQDNLATIDRVAGGREFFEKGLVNTLLSAYYTAAALDLEGVPAAPPADVAPEDLTPEHLKDHGTRVHVPTPTG